MKPAEQQPMDALAPGTRANVSLLMAFVLLIALVVGIGFVGLAQMERANASLQSMGRNEFTALDLARKAMKFSARNNRITLQVFLMNDRAEIDRLLVERAANTAQITELVSQIEKLTDQPEEKKLLAEVKAARTPYVQSYKDALKVLLEGGDRETARGMMVEKTVPNLVAYHSAWEAFSQYQTDDAGRFIAVSAEHYATARVQVLELLAAALFCALAVAIFSTRKLARETHTRECAEAELIQFLHGMEQTVQQRTAELAEANVQLETGVRKLVEVSRQAGMAEVASSVLHNVGNVLNSANVSLEIASGKVRGLKVGALEKVVALLHEHEADLAAFLTAHPQGTKLQPFLVQLSEHFSRERDAAVRELESLRANVEHINEIVSMQQRYAGAGGMMELLPVADLLDDALRMTAASLDRHGARVLREIDPALPSVPIDRHKVLQILVNLLRNAAHAMEHAPDEARCMTLRASVNADRRVRISVIDSGIGISPENLPRIFEHGFTTKKDGHGFGLHSSAQSALDMGGALLVHSEGRGHGATFTLELPCQPLNS